MDTYERIAQIIRYLDQNYTGQPDLNTIARKAGMSPFHFHRLFSAWAGITPKDFLQCLTIERIKHRLREGKSVLEAAYESGLSGPGRLHDLCVSLEAASPGEIKNGGLGLVIKVGFVESPFGRCLIAETARGICHLSFNDSKKQPDPLHEIRKEWPKAELHRNDSHLHKLAARIFNRSKKKGSKPLSAFVKGTPFQVNVWRALLKVPSGSLITYGTLAKAVKKPKAARAVGSAVASNPIAYLIPCHRVIREIGIIGQYHWGPLRKKIMIGWEAKD